MLDRCDEVQAEGVLCLRINGGLRDKENEELGGLVDERAAESGKLRLFLIFEDYSATDGAESLYDDLKFVKIHADRIERMAVVADGAWQQTWIALFGLFGGVKTAYFEHADMAEAVRWVSDN
jgi:hypothetical protein